MDSTWVGDEQWASLSGKHRKYSKVQSRKKCDHNANTDVDDIYNSGFYVTVLMVIAFLLSGFSSGLHTGNLGPSLLDLQILTSSTTDGASTLFTWRGAAAMIGAAVSATVFDKFNGFLAISLALICCGTSAALSPLFDNLIIVGIFNAFSEGFNSMLSAGTNYMTFRFWHWKGGNIMILAVRLMLQLGKAVVPLILQPFLIPTKEEDDDGRPGKGFCTLSGTTFPINSSMQNDIDTGLDMSFLNQTIEEGISLQLKYGFFIVGAFSGVVAILFFCIFLLTGYKVFNEHTYVRDDAPHQAADSVLKKGVILTFFFFMFLLYSCIEAGFSGMLMTFVINYLGWSKDEGVLINTIYQGVKVVASLLIIPFARCVQPGFLLFFNAMFNIVAGVVMLIALSESMCAILIWVGAMFLGIGMCTVNANSYLWLQTRYIMTGKLSGFVYVAYNLGSMVGPPISSAILSNFGVYAFPYTILGFSLLFFICYLLLSILMYNKGKPMIIFDSMRQVDLTSSSDHSTKTIKDNKDPERQPLLGNAPNGSVSV